MFYYIKYRIYLAGLLVSQLKNNFLNNQQKTYHHNIERICVIKFMERLLEDLNKDIDLRILMISDHGSRISKDKNSSNSVIFAYKDRHSTGTQLEIYESSQQLFKEKLSR